MADSRASTFQARLTHDVVLDRSLDAYAELYGRVERKLFARMQADQDRFDINTVKPEFMTCFGFTGRQFNALYVGLKGKIASIVELRNERKAHLVETIHVLTKTIQDLEKPKVTSTSTTKTVVPLSKSIRLRLHKLKRRLGTQQARLERIQQDEKAGKVRLTFGTNKRFHDQFKPSGKTPDHGKAWTRQKKKNTSRRQHVRAMSAPVQPTHEEWKSDWQRARSSQFFVLGSQDETAGNQSCQATVQQDGTLTLKLRLPDAVRQLSMEDHNPDTALPSASRYVTMTGLWFRYGHETILQALASSRKITTVGKDKNGQDKPVVKLTGTALNYRFFRDEKGWRVCVSIDVPQKPLATNRFTGAIGVDLNADHLAIAETDASGNLINAWRMPLVTYGKTTDQVKALIGDVCTHIAEYALAVGKPVVHENLDFRRKKQDLSNSMEMARGKAPKGSFQKKYARMLSSLSYRAILSGLQSACFRRGVETIGVNPAYTSVIGAVNHAARCGISVHMGAALAIARRGLGFAERPTVRVGKVPTRKGGHVTFVLPERNRAKHGWSHWSKVRRALIASHAASGRSVTSQALAVAMARTAPVFPGGPPEPGAHRSLRVKSPDAKGRTR